METVRFEAGQEIFAEGSAGKVMYVLASGRVELRKASSDSSTLLKVIDQKNDIFGEMALIDDLPRSASAVAVEPTELFVINEANFEHLVRTNGAFAFKVIQILSDRLRSSNRQIGELAETDVKDRCLRAMADYGRLAGEKVFSGDLKVSVEPMAAWINSHVGIALKDIELQVARLVKQGVTPLAATAAKTRDSILLSPDFMAANDRRRGERRPAGPAAP